jgi:large subunit ribosomal protein L13
MIVLNADGAILGRLASYAAKQILSGETVVVINAEKIIVTGNKQAILKKYAHKRARGSRHKGPFFPRYPDRIVRRVIRGMVPYKREKGAKAMKRLKVVMGAPEKYKDSKKIGKDVEELTCKYLRLEDISRHLGAKV